MIKFVKINETYIRMICEPHILHEVSPHFDFYAKNYQYHPLVKSGKWDGVTRLMSNKTGRFYVGLLKVVILKCKELGYSQFSFEGFEDSTSEWVENDVLTLIDEFKLPDGYILREYQLYAILTCLLGVRRLCLAATNSGKSLIQYIISRVLLDANKKVLIIVPSVFLVDQIYKDFQDYAMADSFSVEDNYHKIFAGQAKTSDKMCYISTYHSLNSIPKDELSGYLENFDSILCDECLHPDSLISMADGTKVKISDINIGDNVITLNETTNQIEINKVIRVHKNLINSVVNDMYQITLMDGTTLKLTGNHKVYTNNGWLEVKQLTGDEEIEIY